MTRLTAQEIEAIRKRLENATEGPWKDYVVQFGCNRADAVFIAHAREDIPKLLAEVEHLTGVIGTLRSKLELIEEVNEYASGYLAKEAIEYANEELR